MARINPVDPSFVDSQVETIFSEIQKTFGRIPNLFKTYARHPPLLETNWHKIKRILLEGLLSRKTKEAIALLVSQDNGCQYCVAAHTGALKMIGISDEEIERISARLEEPDFSPLERALISFARRANAAPHKVTDEEFQVLKAVGASDAEIVEALGVMEIFTAFNKFLDVLDVELG